ncbi:hypothetical protein QYE76_025642 [Lolium multiflorum]|uniref:Uncharacterized protein n=1 Tax=Lolium multiflorum TaxID=4521 RepID=A0AAD8RFY9_LOLMU|nr:hypothetical protein QYE76_025642 [Lolium multiflorum]
MENYSLLMGAAAVMKMAVEMAAVSMEKPSGALPVPACRNRLLSPRSWLRDGGGSGRFRVPWLIPLEVTGSPIDMLEKESLMVLLAMIGSPLDVDMLFIKKHEMELVRVRSQCRFSERIKGSIQLFVNGEPHSLDIQAK